MESFKNNSRIEKPGAYSDTNTHRTVYNQLELPEEAQKKIEEKEKWRQENTVDKKTKYTEHSQEWKEQQTLLQDVSEEKAVTPVAELFLSNNFEGKTPYEIFGVAEGDSIEAYKSYRRMIRSFHPDVVNAQVDILIKEVFAGADNAFDRFNEYIKKLNKYHDNQPKILNEKELATLAEEKRADYIIAHQVFKKETPSRDVLLAIRDEISERAKKKTQLLAQAWEQIKKGLSYEEIVGVSSLWNTEEGEHDRNHYWLNPNQTIKLEGEAEIYRELDFFVTDNGQMMLQKAGQSLLQFASGWDKELGIYEGYREVIPIKHLFAFLELRVGHRVSSALLSDVADKYDLTNFDVEKLQDLLKDGADPKQICKELNIKTTFEEPSRTTLRQIDIKDTVRDIFKNKEMTKDEENHFIKHGYTKESIETIAKFVLDKIKEKEEFLRKKNNAFFYSFSKSSGKSFEEIKNKEKSESLKNFEKDREDNSLLEEILYEVREMQSKPERFTKDLSVILNGPIYATNEFEEYDGTGYRVGVEFGRDGLRLQLPKQKEGNSYDFSSATEVFFNKNDLGIMKEIAYGRSLTGKNNQSIPYKP